MVKTMKRSLSMLLALLMLLCVFPVSTFAADKKCTLTVGKNNAAVRSTSHQDGEIVERYKKGKSVTYEHLRINDALNLWYGISDGNGGYKYIYSGNVKKVSTPKDNKVTAQVEISRSLLSRTTCLEQAKKLLDNGNTGYSKSQMAKEIFAHAWAYYATVPAVTEAAELYLTRDKLCELFPNQCVVVTDVIEALVSIYKPFLNANNKAVCVEIGEEKPVNGFVRTVLYEIWWDMVQATTLIV
ncbi:MAG: hypothetical protein IKR84_06985 [Oscillibacter sp.]|nr:hypothetical protein [Oscillibacter sp.]